LPRVRGTGDVKRMKMVVDYIRRNTGTESERNKMHECSTPNRKNRVRV